MKKLRHAACILFWLVLAVPADAQLYTNQSGSLVCIPGGICRRAPMPEAIAPYVEFLGAVIPLLPPPVQQFLQPLPPPPAAYNGGPQSYYLPRPALPRRAYPMPPVPQQYGPGGPPPPPVDYLEAPPAPPNGNGYGRLQQEEETALADWCRTNSRAPLCQRRGRIQQ